MLTDIAGKYEKATHGIMRIVVGLLFMTHGGQKLFAWFGADQPAELISRFGIAGVLEFFGGIMVALGLFTRPTAFILSGQMAVAYFWIHLQRGIWPWTNGGELAAIYSFVFLFLAMAGGGSFSIDNIMNKKKES